MLIYVRLILPPIWAKAAAMKRLLLAFALLFCAPALVGEVTAQTDQSPKVAARLVAEAEAAPGGTLWVALEEQIKPQWHTYWINPGDAGDPTSIEWTVPAG